MICCGIKPQRNEIPVIVKGLLIHYEVKGKSFNMNRSVFVLTNTEIFTPNFATSKKEEKQ